jgi:hypothetical protein
MKKWHRSLTDAEALEHLDTWLMVCTMTANVEAVFEDIAQNAEGDDNGVEFTVW